jgi:purine nucleosidase
MHQIIIDTDTGSDDAVALIMALKHPDARVQAITTVAGNVPLPQATQNALFIVEQCDAHVPVFMGCAKPLLRPLHTGQHVHGQDGMGDIGLPLAGRKAADGHAADVLREFVARNPNEIVLVTLGPLTNVALALLREPELAQQVKHCYIMGGTSDNRGNVGLVGEFNIWVAPEAAKIVFESGMPLTMIGWDISRKYAVFDEMDATALRALDTPLARLSVDIQAKLTKFAHNETGLAGFDLPDPIAMSIALDETIITASENYFVTVETGDGPSRGQTVLDHRGMTRRYPNTRVVLEANREQFVEQLKRAVIRHESI